MEKILQNLLFTTKEVRCQLEEALTEAGGSLPVWLVLHTLIDSEGVIQTHLANSINIETPTLTRHLDRLEHHGLIERRSDANDRRVTRIYLSTAGRCMHSNLLAVVRCFEGKLVAGLTTQETADFNRLLNQIKTNLTHRSIYG